MQGLLVTIGAWQVTSWKGDFAAWIFTQKDSVREPGFPGFSAKGQLLAQIIAALQLHLSLVHLFPRTGILWKGQEMSHPDFPGAIRKSDLSRVRERSCMSLLLHRSFFFGGKYIAQCTKMAQGNEGRLYCMKFCKVDFMQQGPGFQPNSQGTI